MKFKKITDQIWEIPKTFKEGMRVPARIYATEDLLPGFDEKVIDQITNVATLPGIQKHAMCMPDGHMGYGFPIGGVAAFDPEEDGVISPGGIGFDINCGMRLVTTNMTWKQVEPKIKELMDHLFKTIPAGVGKHSLVRLRPDKFKEVVEQGASWCIEQGLGWDEDLERIEDHGRIDWADASKVSDRALQRGLGQLGTLGSGNHYLEVQTASKDEIFDERLAKKFGITQPDQVVIMFHCGSRGFGHQIGTDYLKSFLAAMPKYGINVRDRELACAPFNSEEGQDYYKAMACGANMAFANRQLILHHLRDGFKTIFKQDPEDLGMHMVYDVAHNIAKLEKHKIDNVSKELIVHRKGSTRCFGPSRPELPKLYADSGQPVIVGGSMETGSYLCVGTDKAEETFGSTMHGAGRTMSRTQAKKQVSGEQLQKKMEREHIYVKSVSMRGLAEEAGFAYKNVASVVDVMEAAGISKKVVALRPKGNIKG
ncbi:MAG: RtcB family protein [Candidatus Nanoarchaeia archaeon]